jgi:hypothetical protein
VIGGFKPNWEIEEQGRHSSNEHVINVNLQLEDEQPKQKNTFKANKKKISSYAIWWVIGVVVLLYFLFI